MSFNLLNIDTMLFVPGDLILGKGKNSDPNAQPIIIGDKVFVDEHEAIIGDDEGVIGDNDIVIGF